MSAQPAWDRVKEILKASLELPPGDRAAYLHGACGGDAELREEVESLLRSHDGAGDFLNAPPEALDTEANEDELAQRRLGRQFGHYRVTELIAEGGMGLLYRAEDLRLDRLVALKFRLPAIAVASVEHGSSGVR